LIWGQLRFGVIALVLGSAAAWAAPHAIAGAEYKLTCAPGARHGYASLAGTRYGGNTTFGFDLIASPKLQGSTCSSDQPFFVSVREPDGDYRVTVTLGSDSAESVTTVKAEARRLMLLRVSTPAGQKIKRSFVVNVRTPQISPNERVHLKPREIGGLDWDGKLTLEFIGDHASVSTIVIQPVHVPTIYLAGDSTVVDQEKEPWAAWGQILPSFFHDGIAVANEAESGETIHSFVTEHRFDKIMSTLRPGDYLFMQFAHNDQKPGRGFVPISEYQALLRRYIALARGRGAHPVLVTSMSRRRFGHDGKIIPTLGGYPDAMREVARQEKVPLIDLNAMSKVLFDAMGPDGTLKAFVHYPANTFPNQPIALADNTHFNSYGALELAKCVVQAIRDAKLPLAKDIRKGVAPFDTARPDPPSVWTVPRDPFISTQKPYER
jgi:lysophospholipase L1-like esterase